MKPDMNCYSFNALKIGQEFVCNETRYRKRSSRTADNLDRGGWYYFRTGELCYFADELNDEQVREEGETK